MHLKHQALKVIIRSVLLEGQLEKGNLSIQDIVNKFKNRVLIFFDTETTGMSSKNPYSLVTEIGAIAIDTNTGKELGRYSMKSKLTQTVEDRRKKEREEIAAGTRKAGPGPDMPIDDILKMTAYEEGEVPFEEERKVLAGFSEFVSQYQSQNPIMVAHNARFDMRHINDALKLRHKMPFLPKYNVLDTKVLVEKYLQSLLVGLENLRGTDPEVERLFKELRSTGRFTSRLGPLGTAFEVETKHWHSAIADTLQLSGILAKILDFFERRGDEPYNIGRDIRSGLAKRLPTGEIEYKKTRQKKGAVKPPVKVDEMAIQQFKTVGDWNRRSSFGDVDRKLLTSPKGIKKIKRQWEKTPFNFDMYLVNDPRVNKSKFREIGLVNMDFVRNEMKLTPEEIPEPDENTITIIYTSNTGAERYMASGWILAHRLGHALNASRGSSLGEHWRAMINNLRIRVADILKELYDIDVYSKRYDFEGEVKREKILKYVAQELGTMKSARDKKMRSWYEFAYELLAQYLLTGSIRFNPLPRSIVTGIAAYGRKKTAFSRDERTRETINLDELEHISNELQADIESILEASVGSVFVM